MIYSLDTSIFIDLFNMKKYSLNEFNKTKQIIETKLSEGVILVSKWVIRELNRGNDDIARWLKNYPHAIIETDTEIENFVRKIINAFNNWIDPNSTENEADPQVIALAKVRNGKVVTAERYKNNLQLPHQSHAVKIPNVCEHYNIEFMGIIGFLIEIGSF